MRLPCRVRNAVEVPTGLHLGIGTTTIGAGMACHQLDVGLGLDVMRERLVFHVIVDLSRRRDL